MISSRGRYLAQFSPYIIHGIGPKTTTKLALEDVLSVEELAYCDPSELSDSTGISTDLLSKLRLKAKSLISGEIYRIDEFQFPREDVIYLDIETEKSGGRIWLIGCMVEDQLYQFYADNWNEEKKILEECRELMEEYPGYSLVSYSGTCFDLRILQNAFKRKNVHCEISDRHLDLCKTIRRCYIFPTQGYGLKEVGKLLGYDFKNPNLDGLKIAKMYEEHLQTGQPLDKRVLEYNQDDVEVLVYIVNAMRFT